MATVTKPDSLIENQTVSRQTGSLDFSNSTNVFVLLYLAVQNYINTCNFDATGRYAQQDLMNKQLKEEMANWQKHADDLPNAGNQGKSEDTTVLNGTGIMRGSAFMMIAIGMAGIAAVLLSLGVGMMGVFGIGAILIAAAIAITAAVLSILTFAKKLQSSDYDTIPGYITYDTGLQTKAQNQCQQDQQAVQQLQNVMSQLLQQYITPANNAKDAAANFQQAIFQWLKAIVWSS